MLALSFVLVITGGISLAAFMNGLGQNNVPILANLKSQTENNDIDAAYDFDGQITPAN